jgi:hypothetical protein
VCYVNRDFGESVGRGFGLQHIEARMWGVVIHLCVCNIDAKSNKLKKKRTTLVTAIEGFDGGSRPMARGWKSLLVRNKLLLKMLSKIWSL